MLLIIVIMILLIKVVLFLTAYLLIPPRVLLLQDYSYTSNCQIHVNGCVSITITTVTENCFNVLSFDVHVKLQALPFKLVWPLWGEEVWE